MKHLCIAFFLLIIACTLKNPLNDIFRVKAQNSRLIAPQEQERAIYHKAGYPKTEIIPPNVQAIENRAQELVNLYGNRPYWTGGYIDTKNVPTELIPDIIAHIIPCESLNQDIKVIDSNDYYSYGRLMFQKGTWNELESSSNFYGDPMNGNDAITMALWAIQRNYLTHWSCARILKIIK